MIRRAYKALASLGKSFLYAFRGIRFAIDSERNMRIHLTAVVYVLQFALLYRLESLEYVILIILFALVITAEMINTAIEALVDLHTHSYAGLARVAKDVAAGAVFVLALASVCTAAILFSDWEKLCGVVEAVADFPVFILLFAAEITAGVLFVFFWDHRRRKK